MISLCSHLWGLLLLFPVETGGLEVLERLVLVFDCMWDPLVELLFKSRTSEERGGMRLGDTGWFTRIEQLVG